MKKLKIALVLCFSIYALFCQAEIQLTNPNPAEDQLKLYIWEFKTIDGLRDRTTKAITREFEEAFVAKQCFTVVERSAYPELYMQVENERQITGMHNMTDSFRLELEHIQADGVVFGQITIDDATGYVSVATSIEGYSSEILGKESIHFSKRILFDIDALERQMELLVEKTIVRFECYRSKKFKIEREFESMNKAVGGQMIGRASASAELVHGNFGCETTGNFESAIGEVFYQGLSIPAKEKVYLKIRYSKNSPSKSPINIYLDGNSTPLASFIPVNQIDWDKFVWSESIALGTLTEGPHTLIFKTEGQKYGVADLDVFTLSNRKK